MLPLRQAPSPQHPEPSASASPAAHHSAMAVYGGTGLVDVMIPVASGNACGPMPVDSDFMDERYDFSGEFRIYVPFMSIGLKGQHVAP